MRPHLQNIDNVPLLVPLFTDCTPESEYHSHSYRPVFPVGSAGDMDVPSRELSNLSWEEPGNAGAGAVGVPFLGSQK